MSSGNDQDDYQWILESFPSVFNDKIGCLKNYEVKLHIDETVSPVRQPYRRIAYHLIKPTELELENS